MNLPNGLIVLLRQPSPCFVATLMPDGSPQLTQTWVDTDGEHIVINTVAAQKIRNIERDPRVALTVSDPENPTGTSRSAVGPERDRGRRGRPYREAGPALPGRPYPWYGGRGQTTAADHHRG